MKLLSMAGSGGVAVINLSVYLHNTRYDEASTESNVLRLSSHGTGPKWIRPYPVHTAPFRLSTSGRTAQVCYGLVLNRSKNSSCFYQLSMRRIHVEVFKMAPRKSKSIEEGDKAFSWMDDKLFLPSTVIIDYKACQAL